MKKVALLTLLFISACQLQAQEGFIFGFQAGPQNTWILNKDDRDAALDDYKYVMTWGYAGMIKLGYNFGPPLGIHSGITYSMQGQKNEFVTSGDGVTHLAKRSLNYIKIPVLVHISSNPNAPATVVLEFGPQFAIMNNAIHYVDGQVQAPGIDPNLIYEQSEIEVAWALGTDIRLGDNVCLSIMHRGDYGPMDMEDKTVSVSPGVHFFEDNRAKSTNLNLGFMAGMTVNFQIKGMNKFDKRLYWRHR